MFWYIFIVLMMIGIAVISLLGYLQKIDTSNITIPIIFIILFIFMGFRDSSIGADTAQYTWAFMQLKDINIDQIFVEPIYGVGGGYELNLEYGYKLYNIIVSFFSDNPQAIIVSDAALILGLLYLLIKKYSSYPFLSLWLYVTLGIFQTQMNMSRNAIGILICYLALGFIHKRQAIKYVFSILLASIFHASAILFLPLYWVIKYIPLKNAKVFKVLLLMAVIIGISFPLFQASILPFIPVRYQIYAMGDTSQYESLFLGLFHLLLLLIIYLFSDRELINKSFKLLPVGTWMFTLDMLFYCIGANWAVGTRIAGLFGPFLIIYIPNLISKAFYGYNNKLIIIILIIVLSGIQYIIRIHFNNIGLTMPYQFYFM